MSWAGSSPARWSQEAHTEATSERPVRSMMPERRPASAIWQRLPCSAWHRGPHRVRNPRSCDPHRNPGPRRGRRPRPAFARRAGRQERRTAGLRRYTTSKLLAAATAGALARERPDVHVTCFDPGMMPGTGLARQHPAPVRALWSSALKGLRVLPFASSPRASGRALATLICQQPPAVASGSYLDHRLRAVAASSRTRDTASQDSVLRQSRQLLAPAR